MRAAEQICMIGGADSGGGNLYLGQVATRSFFPTVNNATPVTSMQRTYHYARDDITSLQIAIPNWYVNTTTFVETGAGSDATVTASIEYPAGTFTQVKFAGSASGTIPTLTSLLSDAAVVSIPKGAVFFVRVWRSCAGGIVFNGQSQDPAGGDFFRYGSAVVDQTMSGTITSSDTTNISFPMAIVARTRRPSIFLLGDSRVYGLNDTTYDATGDKGEFARAIGPTMGYINAGVPSDKASAFVTGSAQRRAIAQYCSGVVLQYGINDLAGGASDATLRASLNSAAALFPGKKVILATMPPSTTGAWTLADGSDQTVKSFEALRVSNNDWRRTVPTGFTSCFEIADVVEISRNNGKWKADGTVAKYTSDGVHESTFANTTIRDSGAVALAALAR